MSQRLNYQKASPDGLAAMLGLEQHARRSGLEHSLLELVKTRVSQINGCAYCLDMHTKDARAAGETEQRLYLLPAWRETGLYTPRERAALAWAEAVTRLTDQHVPDAVYDEARRHFDEKAVDGGAAPHSDKNPRVVPRRAVPPINGWTRLSIAFQVEAGSYQPPKARP